MAADADRPRTTDGQVDRHGLVVRDLHVAFKFDGCLSDVVRGVTFELRPGEVLGLVGESGSGKSVTALALLGLVRHVGGVVSQGSVELGGTELVGLSERQWARVRGRRISIVFQNPIGSLNPAFTIGDQISEVLRLHTGADRRTARRRAIELLDRVGIVRPADRYHDYPNALSGGMCQRAIIAIAIAAEPEVLVADEPTTALDPTVQTRVLDLLQEIQHERKLAMLFVSHDLDVVRHMSDRIAVMYAGSLIEQGDNESVLDRSAHPYTRALMRSAGIFADGRFRGIPGTMPRLGDLPPGCIYAPRCAHFQAGICDDETPSMHEVDHGHVAACERLHDVGLEDERVSVA